MNPAELIGGASERRKVLDRLPDHDKINLSPSVSRKNVQLLFAGLFK